MGAQDASIPHLDRLSPEQGRDRDNIAVSWRMAGQALSPVELEALARYMLGTISREECMRLMMDATQRARRRRLVEARPSMEMAGLAVIAASQAMSSLELVCSSRAWSMPLIASAFGTLARNASRSPLPGRPGPLGALRGRSRSVGNSHAAQDLFQEYWLISLGASPNSFVPKLSRVPAWAPRLEAAGQNQRGPASGSGRSRPSSPRLEEAATAAVERAPPGHCG